MISFNLYKQNLDRLRNMILVTTVFFSLWQIYVDQSAENILSTVLCVTVIVVSSFLIIHPRTARGGAAFTGTAVLLSIFSNSLNPMIGTLIEGNPLIYTLENPVLCFSHRLVFAMVLLAAHFIANSATSRSAKGVLGDCADIVGLRSVLTVKQIWIVGAGGLVLQVILKSDILGDGAISKVLQGMTFLAVIPFILVIPPFSRILVKRPLWIFGLVAIYLLNVFAGITSRMSLVGPFAMIAAAYLIAVLSGQASLPIIKPAKAIAIGLAGIFLAGQLADLSAAIISVRDRRGERSVLENFQATITNFFDKEHMLEYKKQREVELANIESRYGEVWKENYISNPFLSRFTSVKFDDNLFTTAKFYTPMNVLTIKAVTMEKLYAMMPQPVIDALDIKVDKTFIMNFSMGDLMDVLVNKNGFLGGFRVGSITVHSYVVFGWWYPLWLTMLFTVLFVIFQTVGTSAGRGGGATGVSTFALVYGFTLYVSFGMDGYYQLISVFIRGAWQVFLLYGLAIWVAKMISPSRPKNMQNRGGKRLKNREARESRRTVPQVSEPILPPPFGTPPEAASAP
jgi:hypothetical protein